MKNELAETEKGSQYENVSDFWPLVKKNLSLDKIIILCYPFLGNR